MKKAVVMIWLALFTAAQGEADPILVIRHNYQAVNWAIGQGKFKVNHKDSEVCGSVMGWERTLWTDVRGIPRRYLKEGGSGDSASQFVYYLNTQGKVNFLLIERNDVEGRKDTIRLYYNSSGKIIRRVASSEYISGFERQMNLNVKQDFDASSSCSF